MKTWTLPLITVLLATTLVSPVAMAKGKPRAEEGTKRAPGVEAVKVVEAPTTPPQAPDEVPAMAQEPPGETPLALAQGVNALPAPPSMQELLAQGGKEEGAPNKQDTLQGARGKGGASGGSSLALGFGLFLMGTGLGAGAVMTRRKNGTPGNASTPRLKHVRSIRLSPKHQISLIEAQGRQLVVGITSAQMTLLATLDEDADQDAALADALLQSAPSAVEPEALAVDATAPRASWDELFSSAIKQRQQTLHSQVPESKVAHKNKLTEPREGADALPPSLTQATSPERLEALKTSLTSHSVVHETEDYTLEEEEEEEVNVKVAAATPPQVEEEVTRHDGMFAAHDAMHHADTTPRKVRRSRESDSMLIALAAMREEVSR